MSDDIAIRVRGLGKKYNIGGPQEKYFTMRDAIVNSVKAPFKRFHRAPPSEEFWALKDVSFDVEQGDVVGIIGRNGAGKSTLLKILSRITAPTEGTVELHGRVGSLLEVGTGFHPEMTGRENIFLNGSILGMKKTEIEKKFDEIVKFAEIDKFIDTPVKRYSSGMYVRLAFAVAAHLEPEILVVDEVLAVGDAGFQKKCLGKMEEVAEEGRTVLFVSHNMAAIGALCNSGMVLDNGKISYIGDIENVVSIYTGTYDNNTNDINEWIGSTGDNTIKLLHTWIKSTAIEGFIDTTSEIEVGFQVSVLKKIDGLIMGFMLYSGHGGELAYTLYDDREEPPSKSIAPGSYKVVFKIPPNTLSHGNYRIKFDIGIHMIKRIIHDEGSLIFHVENINGLGRRFVLPDLQGRGSLFRPNWLHSVQKTHDKKEVNYGNENR